MRVSEPQQLYCGDVILHQKEYKAALTLHSTKMSDRRHASEIVTLEDPISVAFIHFQMAKSANGKVFKLSLRHFRKIFAQSQIRILKQVKYTPHSVRRGAASTALQFLSMSQIMAKGRWSHSSTATLYVRVGAQMIEDSKSLDRAVLESSSKLSLEFIAKAYGL